MPFPGLSNSNQLLGVNGIVMAVLLQAGQSRATHSGSIVVACYTASVGKDFHSLSAHIPFLLDSVNRRNTLQLTSV